jgi:hypothetical protein
MEYEEMNIKVILSVILSLCLLSACGGTKKSEVIPPPEEPKPKPVIPVPENITVTGIPKDLQPSGCIDSDGDFTCDTQYSSLSSIYNGVKIENLAENAKVALKFSPIDEIGVSQFSAFEGQRYMSVPATEPSEFNPISALAVGLLEFAKEAGDDWCGPCNLVAPTTYQEAKLVLKEQFKLTGTDAQNTAILATINYNLELLGNQGLPLRAAYDADIKAMAESLVDLTIANSGNAPDLSNIITVEHDGRIAGTNFIVENDVKTCLSAQDQPCILEVVNKPAYLLGLTKSEATTIAFDYRKEDDKSDLLPYEAIFKEAQCKDGEQQSVYVYGVADDYANNTIENSISGSYAQNLLTSLQNQNINVVLASYDDSRSQTVFGETITLPSYTQSGIFTVGLRLLKPQNEDTQSMLAWDWSSNHHLVSDVATYLTDATNGWQQTNTSSGNVMYYNTLAQTTVDTTTGASLLDIIHSGSSSEFVVSDNVEVDFIAISACLGKKAKPKPQPIKELIDFLGESFTCNATAGEYAVTIQGGLPDDFTPSTDGATPSSLFASLIATSPYDHPVESFAIFGDTLTLPAGVINKAQLMINLRNSGYSLYNSSVIAASLANSQFVILDSNSPHVSQYATSNNGQALVIDGMSATNVATSSLLNMIQNNAQLDIMAYPFYEVDTALLQLCVSKKCRDTDNDGWCDDEEIEMGSDPTNPHSTPEDLDGDGVLNEDDCAPQNPDIFENCNTTPTPPSCSDQVSIELRPASSWTNLATGQPPVVGNVFANTQYAAVWDDTLNWFNFGSASGVTHKLAIDFCSCGEGKVVVDNMKSDNYSHVYLDDDTLPANSIVRRTAYSQSTMATWGPVVSNSGLVIPYSGSGVNHRLVFAVENASGPSGGAIDGQLSFQGHLGQCTDEDVLAAP